jgi:hypothetical protein
MGLGILKEVDSAKSADLCSKFDLKSMVFADSLNCSQEEAALFALDLSPSSDFQGRQYSHRTQDLATYQTFHSPLSAVSASLALDCLILSLQILFIFIVQWFVQSLLEIA